MSNQTKHTPGPWSDDGDYIRAKAGNNRPDLMRIAEIFPVWSEAEGAANAKLIAAAPDMAEALRLMLDVYGKDATGGVSDQARAALVKAGL